VVLAVMAVALVIASVGIWVFRRKGLAKPSSQFQNRLDNAPAPPKKDMILDMDEEDYVNSNIQQQSRVNFVTETNAPSHF
jgi:hypothetical protein